MDRKIEIVVCGACGKMGKRIIELLGDMVDMVLAGAVEKSDHPDLHKFVKAGQREVPIAGAIKDIGVDFDKVDVIVDFTTPEAALRHMTNAAFLRKPIVVGTTGFTSEQQERFAQAACGIPCVWANNMSVGANLLFKLAGEIARTLSDYDVEIIEAHHNQKKDAPSGTALKLAQDIAHVRDITKAKICVGRRGILGPRKDTEIGVHAVRAGDIVGEHTVIFAGSGERIEIIHKAHSRDGFAYGALRAARWIIGKPAGLYTMEDVLGKIDATANLGE